MNNLILGGIYGMLAQIGTFLQLQGNIKYGWYEKYPWIVLLSSIPLGWLYIQSVKQFTIGFNGEIWPSRLIGFSIGIMVFTTMSHMLFKEPVNLKTFICLLLAFSILLIQLFWK
jgi:multidrug transporter EmrE-like cation transporter